MALAWSPAASRALSGTLAPSRSPSRWLVGLRDQSAPVEHVGGVGRRLEVFRRPLPLTGVDPLGALQVIAADPARAVEGGGRSEGEAASEPRTRWRAGNWGSAPAPARSSHAVRGLRPITPTRRDQASQSDFPTQVAEPNPSGEGHGGAVLGRPAELARPRQAARLAGAPMPPALAESLPARELERLAAGRTTPGRSGRGRTVEVVSANSERPGSTPRLQDGLASVRTGRSRGDERPSGSETGGPVPDRVQLPGARARAATRSDAIVRRPRGAAGSVLEETRRRPADPSRQPFEASNALVALLTAASTIDGRNEERSSESSRHTSAAVPLPPSVISRAFREPLGRDALSGDDLATFAAPGSSAVGESRRLGPRRNRDRGDADRAQTGEGSVRAFDSGEVAARAASAPDRLPGLPAPLIQRETEPAGTAEGPVAVREPSPGETPSPMPGPAVQNTFNVTVHLAAGESADDEALMERVTRVLVDQARRHGIDV